MKVLCYCLLLIIVFSCNSENRKSSCIEITLKYLVEKNGKLSYSDPDSVYFIFDHGINNKKGVYTFYKSMQLKEYMFFQDTINYSYSERYRESGKLDTIIGSPFVRAAPEGNPQDSIKINFKLFNLNKTIIECKVMVNNNEYNHFVFKADTVFSNMLTSQIVYHTSGESELNIHAECILRTCTGEERKFHDSLFLKF